MAQHQIDKQLSSIFDEFNELRRRLRAIEAKHDELQVDCSTTVAAMRRVLAADSSDTNKLSQIFIMVETFPQKHLTRRDELGGSGGATGGRSVRAESSAQASHRDSAPELILNMNGTRLKQELPSEMSDGTNADSEWTQRVQIPAVLSPTTIKTEKIFIDDQGHDFEQIYENNHFADNHTASQDSEEVEDDFEGWAKDDIAHMLNQTNSEEDIMDGCEPSPSPCSTPTSPTIKEESDLLNDPKLLQTVRVIIEDCMNARSTTYRPNETARSEAGDHQGDQSQMVEIDTDQWCPSQSQVVPGEGTTSSFAPETDSRGNGISFQCYRCQKHFRGEPDCRQHMSSMCVTPFVCRICEKLFRSQSELSRHLDYHIGADPNGGKEIRNKAKQTNRHVDHTKEKLYACHYSNCNAKFAHKLSIYGHQRVHSDERLHACSHPGCEWRSKSNWDLKKHRFVHVNERPYACTHPGCDWRSKTKDDFKRHRLVHSDQRQHACSHPNCTSRFKSKGDLLSHRRVHTNERPFACTYPNCEWKFKSKTELQSHHNRVHKDAKKSYVHKYPKPEEKLKRKRELEEHQTTSCHVRKRARNAD